MAYGIDASVLTAGTVPDARFPATLPAASGVNLTALNGTNIASGTVAVARGGTGASTLLGAGIPTLSAANTFTGAQTITQTAQASTAENPLTIGVSDDVTAKFQVINSSATDGVWITKLLGTGSSTNTALAIQADATTDSGGQAVMLFRTRTTANAAIATRIPFYWQNLNTEMMTLSAAGVLNPVGGVAVGTGGTTLTLVKTYAPSLTPAAVSATTSAEQTFTVSGLTTADKVYVDSPASLGDGLGIVGVRVSAADTLAIRFINTTAGSLTPVAGTYPVVAIRS